MKSRYLSGYCRYFERCQDFVDILRDVRTISISKHAPFVCEITVAGPTQIFKEIGATTAGVEPNERRQWNPKWRESPRSQPPHR